MVSLGSSLSMLLDVVSYDGLELTQAVWKPGGHKKLELALLI